LFMVVVEGIRKPTGSKKRMPSQRRDRGRR
jgi:hypothetical protein